MTLQEMIHRATIHPEMIRQATCCPEHTGTTSSAVSLFYTPGRNSVTRQDRISTSSDRETPDLCRDG
jgi:hypothetical protein